MWLGGRRKSGGDAWEWSDGRLWNYQNWDEEDEGEEDCMTLDFGKWWSHSCNDKHPFICVNHPLKMVANHKFAFKSSSLKNQSLIVWWNESFADIAGFRLK